MVTSLGWVIVWSWIQLIPWKIDKLQGEFWRLCCLDANPMYLEKQTEAGWQRWVAYVWSTCGTRKHSRIISQRDQFVFVGLSGWFANRNSEDDVTYLHYSQNSSGTRASNNILVKLRWKTWTKLKKAVRWGHPWIRLAYSLCHTWEINASAVSVWLWSEILFFIFWVVVMRPCTSSSGKVVQPYKWG